VLVDPKSLAYIDGTSWIFVREGLNEGFQVQQPERARPLRLRRVVPGRLTVAGWTTAMTRPPAHSGWRRL
jgi:hypothetical protein